MAELMLGYTEIYKSDNDRLYCYISGRIINIWVSWAIVKYWIGFIWFLVFRIINQIMNENETISIVIFSLDRFSFSLASELFCYLFLNQILYVWFHYKLYLYTHNLCSCFQCFLVLTQLFCYRYNPVWTYLGFFSPNLRYPSWSYCLTQPLKF